MASVNKNINLDSATVWVRCSICHGWLPSIAALKQHAEKSHGKERIVLPKKLHPEHEDDKIYTSYDTPYHQDPLPPPLPLSLLNTTSCYYPNTKSNAELPENCSKSSAGSVVGIYPSRIGDVSVSAILSETSIQKLSESQFSENQSACEPEISSINKNTNRFQCKQCKLIFQNMQSLLLHMESCGFQTDSDAEKVVININTDNTGNLQSWIAGGGSAESAGSNFPSAFGSSSISRSYLQSKLSASSSDVDQPVSKGLPLQKRQTTKKLTSAICQTKNTRRNKKVSSCEIKILTMNSNVRQYIP